MSVAAAEAFGSARGAPPMSVAVGEALGSARAATAVLVAAETYASGSASTRAKGTNSRQCGHLKPL